MTRLLAALVLLASGMPISSAAAMGAPADELLRMTPPDAGFCFFLRDLRGHADRLGRSPFAADLKSAVFTKALLSAPEFQRLADFEKFVESALKVKLGDLRDDVLGDGVVAAYWPAAKGEPERGLFLTHARKPDLVRGMVERLQALMTASGDLVRVEQRSHRGFAYAVWTEKNGKQNHVFLRDGLLGLTEHEPTLKQALERLAEAGRDSGVGQRLRQLDVHDALATLWINPRAFDAALDAAQQAGATPAEQAFRKNLLRYWKAAKGIALAVYAERELELHLAVQFDAELLPGPARRLLASAERPSDLWLALPPRPMLAAAGRCEFTALFETVTEFAPPELRKRLETELGQGVTVLLRRDLVRDVLPYLGPNWGFFICAPGPDAKTWFPRVAVALEVRPGPDADAPLDQAIFDALRTLAGLTTLPNSAGREPLALRTERHGDTPVVSLHGEKQFPPGLQPAFAVKRGYLLLASGPAVIAAFGESPAQAPRPRRPGDVLLARLWAREIVAYLQTESTRNPIVEALAHAHDLPAREVALRIDKLCSVLSLFDEIDLVCRSRPEGLRVGLSFRTSKPLHP